LPPTLTVILSEKETPVNHQNNQKITLSHAADVVKLRRVLFLNRRMGKTGCLALKK